MAYVNVRDWSVEQVTEWLKGLDNVILPYAKYFLNNGVNGHQLLNLRVDDLEHLGVAILGHQELILESVELIRNFHYELDKENLQMLALRLSCAANSLNRELQVADENDKMVQTQHMSDVHNIISTIKPLVCWLNRSPFYGVADYNDRKRTLLQLGIEMATNAHRDIFSEKPVKSIRQICEKLTKMADSIIQEISDPMILQPATLALSTLKKKEQEIGFFIVPSNNAVHQITDIKYGSPAHMSTKIEEGDEIVQVNYQTVVGWQRKKVMLVLQESPPEIVLTLKKRPRHTKVYGQIYMKPYRLPSKKRAAQYSRWNENLPSPRLLTIPDLPQISVTKTTNNIKAVELDIETSSGSDSEPPDSPLDNGGRLYPMKPRSVLQRRNTITGATFTDPRTSHAIEQYWKILKNQATSTHSSSYHLPTDKFEDESMYIRDKSASCSHGLEFSQRPTTVIGLTHKNSFKTDFPEKTKKNVNFNDTQTIICDERIVEQKIDDKKSVSTTSLSSLKDEIIEFIDEAEDLQDRSKMTHDSEKVETVSVKSFKETIYDTNKPKTNKSPIKDTVLEDVHIDNIIKKFDKKSNENLEKPKVTPRTYISKLPIVPQKPTVFPRSSKNRGKLDKSHSTPAYDLTNEENESFTKETLKDSITVSEEMMKIPNSGSALTSPKLINDLKTSTSEGAIKYELGIPILHEVTFSPPIIESKKKNDTKNCPDVPPKPPPRTNIPETFKRKLPDVQSQTCNEIIKLSDVSHVKNEKKVGAEVEKPEVSFDPVSASTPIKPLRDDILRVNTQLRNLDENKVHKTSPTNLVVRAIYSSKSKAVKKKNSSLIAKKRKVSVNDVSPGEIQGYLYQRLRSKHNQNVHWEKRWFVLNQHCLYGFKTKESNKAECYIYLSGFTVTVATEVKSRSYAFKVYHTGTVFYFSAENEEILLAWLEMISAAILKSDPCNLGDQILYSETDDDSDSETPNKSSTLEKSSDGIRKFNSLKKFTTKKRGDNSVSGSTSLDRKWWSNNQKNTLPVPTAQFRSYRKIPTSTTIGNFTSHIPNFANKLEISPETASVSNLSIESNYSNKIDHTSTYGTIASNYSTDSTSSYSHKMGNSAQTANQSNSVTNLSIHNVHETDIQKTRLLNHLHASNPSLCNSEYNAFPFHLPKPKYTENLAGFVTLEELMNREAGEKREHMDDVPINPNLIRPDVVYGEIPIRPNREVTEYRSGKKTHIRTASDCSEPKKESSCFGKRSSSIKSGTHSFSSSKNKNEVKTNNSLPRNVKSIESTSFLKHKSNSSKSLSRNKEKPYEMIYCPQTTTDVHFAQNRTLDGRMFQETPKKNLKSAGQYTPMALPLTPDEKLKYNPQNAFELNLDEKTTHKSGKFKFFMKQDSKKDKKTAPKYTRTDSDISSWPASPMMSSSSILPGSFSKSITDISEHSISNSPPAADYPGLEYPPIFEPETYSLANPQGTLLRKQSRKY